MSAVPLHPMARSDFWRRSYDERRYMRTLTQDELNHRFRDLFLNFLRLKEGDATIGLVPVNEDGSVWIEKITHFFEEMYLRHGPPPAGFTREMVSPGNETFPDFASDLARKAATRIAQLNLKRGDVFMKFGRRRHMEDLYKAGVLRVQAASYFSANDHNLAIKDDELNIVLSGALSRADVLRLVQNPRDVPPNLRDQHVKMTITCPTDYWLYCLTNSVQPRLFVDFKADTCVIVRDRDAFRQKLAACAKVNDKLSQSKMREGNANYIDPLLPPKDISPNICIPLTKYFGYTYQDEYRFCWIPKTAQEKVPYIDLELGSLTGIAELINL